MIRENHIDWCILKNKDKTNYYFEIHDVLGKTRTGYIPIFEVKGLKLKKKCEYSVVVVKIDKKKIRLSLPKFSNIRVGHIIFVHMIYYDDIYYYFHINGYNSIAKMNRKCEFTRRHKHLLKSQDVDCVDLVPIKYGTHLHVRVKQIGDVIEVEHINCNPKFS